MTITTMKITGEVAKTLKSYVYVYIDPRNGKPFYVGKGKGNRLFSHLRAQSIIEKEKVAKIAEIRRTGREPRIEILRYGLSDLEAHLVEAASIDLIGKARLTNRMAGQICATRSFPIVTSMQSHLSLHGSSMDALRIHPPKIRTTAPSIDQALDKKNPDGNTRQGFCILNTGYFCPSSLTIFSPVPACPKGVLQGLQ